MPKKPLNRVLALSGAGIQLAATVFAGAWIGRYLDDHYPLGERKIYTLVFVLAFTAIAIFNVLRQVNRINKK